MDNPFVGFNTFAKQRTDDDGHPYGEDSHLDEDSILERHGDVETGDNYYEPDDYDDDSDEGLGRAGRSTSTTPLYEREDPYPPDKMEWEIDEEEAQAAEKRAKINYTQGGTAVLPSFEVPARSDDTSMNKSHDEMMSSLDQVIGFMEKQVGEDDEPTGYEGVTAVRQASRRGMVEDSDVDPLEVSEEFEYTPELNESQIAAIEEASRERQQGVAENEVPEPRSQRIHNPAAAELAAEKEERDFQQDLAAGVVSDTPIENRKAARNLEDFKRSEKERWARRPIVAPGKYRPARAKPKENPTRGFTVSTPQNISTSARENRLEEEDRIKRAEQSRRIREQAVATRDKEIIPMRRPERAEASDLEDDFAQSADSVLAKALGSVIGIMEKQDPRFRCQECGAKVPKSSRKCRKCGSEDIDLG